MPERMRRQTVIRHVLIIVVTSLAVAGLLWITFLHMPIPNIETLAAIMSETEEME